jgi:hypothetical protein
MFAAISVFYTAMAFSGIMRRQDARVFSRQNAKPLSSILTIHFEFLALLWGLMWSASLFYPRLPVWITDTSISRRGYTYLDLLFVLVMGVMYLIERRWIYLEAESDISNV